MTARLLATLTLLLALPALAVAEVVRLKNGNVMEGAVKELSDGQIEINIPGLGLMTFGKDEIESIESDSAEASGAPVDAVPRRQDADEERARPSSGKKELTDEAYYERKTQFEKAQTLFYKAQRAEPTGPLTDYGEAYALRTLERAEDLFQKATSAAQRALEYDLRYEVNPGETRELREIVRESREALSRINRTAREVREHAKRKAEEEEDEQKGRKLGTQTHSDDF